MMCSVKMEIHGVDVVCGFCKFDFAGFCIYCGDKLIELTEVVPHIGPVVIHR